MHLALDIIGIALLVGAIALIFARRDDRLVWTALLGTSAAGLGDGVIGGSLVQILLEGALCVLCGAFLARGFRKARRAAG